jgi:Plasmid encoded RepA protein
MIKKQLELLGLNETIRRVMAEEPSERQRARKLRCLETSHELLSELPTPEDLSFLHSGLCQTCLPHRRLPKNSTIWKRTSGRFTLMVTPGALDDNDRPVMTRRSAGDQSEALYVGVPYGPKARLIMIYLQTEGIKGRFVSLGPSLSAFMRSLGLAVTGGERGTINAVREQSLRIARCNFTMQWTDRQPGLERTIVADTKIVEGLEFWRDAKRQEWNGTVELSERFHTHLKEHAVPLDKRGLALLSGNSLGLDLYALFAYRLPRLKQETHLRWAVLQAQIGADVSEQRELARRIRDVLPNVLSAYPDARVEATKTGLTVRPSNPAVPRTVVSGYRLIEGRE